MREALESALKLAKIRIHTGVRVFGIIPKKNGFQISFSKDGKKGMISGEAVILATGSKAAAKLGSDGSGYDLAKMLGHKLVPVVPGSGTAPVQGKAVPAKSQACVLMEK